LVFHTIIEDRNENGLVNDKKVKELYKYASYSDLDYLVNFAERELRLNELAQFRINNKRPLITDDDKIFIGLALKYIISKHSGKKRDSGRLFLGHPVDTAKEFINTYLDEYLPRTNYFPSTLINRTDIVSCLGHDLIEEEDVTKKEVVKDLRRMVSESGIRDKNKYKYLVIPVIGNNIEALTRGDKDYYDVACDLVRIGNKRLIYYKLSDRTSNMRELEIEPSFERFLNTYIKDMLKRADWVNYPSRRIWVVLSTLFHKGTEKIMDTLHQLEISRRLYPNPKTLYEVFKSFIMSDVANQYMNTRMQDDFLIVLKQRSIREAISQDKRVSEHILKYHCKGLNRMYAISKAQEELLDNPLLILDEPYLKKLDATIGLDRRLSKEDWLNMSLYKKAAFLLNNVYRDAISTLGLRSRFRKEELTNPETVQRASEYLRNHYVSEGSSSGFTVEHLIHIDKSFPEYIMTGGINRMTYPRIKKNKREYPFDNLFNSTLSRVVQGDKKLLEDLKPQHEVMYKLSKVLNYKLWQYYNNHTITFDWGRIRKMKAAISEAADNAENSYSHLNSGRGAGLIFRRYQLISGKY